jgi:hypothetical protein
MRVTIGHTTKKVSMFKSAPAISLAVEFTDVEKAAIQKSGLDEYVLHTPPIHAWYADRMQGPVLVKHLLRGECSWPYNDLAAARTDEPNLRQALKNFKDNIDVNAQPVKAQDTFEL